MIDSSVRRPEKILNDHNEPRSEAKSKRCMHGAEEATALDLPAASKCYTPDALWRIPSDKIEAAGPLRARVEGGGGEH